MVTIAKRLQKSHLHPQMYWGGASFFIRMDHILKRDYNTSFPDLIKEYQSCCRLKDQSIEDVIASWDNLLGGSTCNDLMKSYRTEPASRVFEKTRGY